MAVSNYYKDEFQVNIINNALQSAEIIVPIILNIINPQSVVDIGCGLGAWLSVFQKHGIKKLLGMDGNYVNIDNLLIDKKYYYPIDLQYPFEIGENFDLAICLEVAEHLPRSCVNGFISSITKLAPIVLFSAAVPGQGGIQHKNEQWPDYWKELFMAEGYIMLDAIRPIIWKEHRVAWYYKQNCFLFVKKSIVELDEKFKGWAEMENQDDLLLISKHVLAANLSLIYFLKRIPSLARSVLTRYLRRDN